MNSIWIGCIVGILGTGSGAALTFFLKAKKNALPAILMGFSGGIMLSVVIFDILPEAIMVAGTFTMVWGASIGALFVMAMSKLIPVQNNSTEALQSLEHFRLASLKKTGILLCAGIALHNFPEGVAIGSGLSMPGSFGWELAILIFLHDIPEGMAMSLPLRLAKVSRRKILLTGLLVGSPTALGAWAGVFLGSISMMVVGSCLGFAGGAMLFLTVKEMIPESIRMKNLATTLYSMLLGMAAGWALVRML